MAKKTYKAFPGVNCERLRLLNAALKKREGQRTKQFDAQKKAKEDFTACGKDEIKKRREAEADIGHCELKIEKLASEIKWLRNQLSTTIDGADDETLYDDPSFKIGETDDEDDEQIRDDGVERKEPKLSFAGDHRTTAGA